MKFFFKAVIFNKGLRSGDGAMNLLPYKNSVHAFVCFSQGKKSQLL